MQGNEMCKRGAVEGVLVSRPNLKFELSWFFEYPGRNQYSNVSVADNLDIAGLESRRD